MSCAEPDNVIASIRLDCDVSVGSSAKPVEDDAKPSLVVGRVRKKMWG